MFRAQMPDPGQQRHTHRRTMLNALLRKEWNEQRWRFFLSTVVLSGLLAGLLRAQVIPYNEGALLIYGPVGVVMAIFLAMGPVASERTSGTWEFLVAQPISRADVLLTKWRMGLYQLVGMMAVATLCGLLAMWSRGFYGVATLHQERMQYRQWGSELPEFVRTLIIWSSAHPGIWLCSMGLAATVALACWYTPLFIVLTRARNEFTAAIAGILLAILVHVWLLHVWMFMARGGPHAAYAYSLANPLLPLALTVAPETQVWLPLVLITHACLWVLVPVLLVRRLATKARKA